MITDLNSIREISYAALAIQENQKHERAARIVAAWAERTGHTGPRHTATRQGIRRRIVKHGTSSAYATKFI